MSVAGKLVAVLVIFTVWFLVWSIRTIIRLIGRMHIDLIDLGRTVEDKSDKDRVYERGLQYFISETAWKLKRAGLIQGSANQVIKIDAKGRSRKVQVVFVDGSSELIDLRSGTMSDELRSILTDVALATKIFGTDTDPI